MQKHLFGILEIGGFLMSFWSLIYILKKKKMKKAAVIVAIVEVSFN